MKVLHLNTDMSTGGAPKAAYRIMQAQRAAGLDASMLVKWQKDGSYDHVANVNIHAKSRNAQAEAALKMIQDYYIAKNRTDWNTYYSLGYAGLDLSILTDVQKSDIYNLHWVANYLSPVSISRLLKLGKPVVWTLHDERPFTGGPHYIYESDNTWNFDEREDQLVDDPFGLAKLNLLDQLHLYEPKNLVVVSPSRWLAERAKQSRIFREHKITVIPNAHDTSIFKPQNRQLVRAKFKIPLFAKVILIAARNNNERRKGFDEAAQVVQALKEAPELRKMIEEEKIALMVVGETNDQLKELPFPVYDTGLIKDEQLLAEAYSCADIMLFTTLAENFSNMMCEAMASGTTVIGFDVGGNRDVIQPGVNGELVPKGDVKALTQKLMNLLLDDSMILRYSDSAAEFVNLNFSYEKVASKYKALYEQLVQEFPGAGRPKDTYEANHTYKLGRNLEQKMPEIIAYTKQTYATQMAEDKQSRSILGRVKSAVQPLISLIPDPIKEKIKSLLLTK